MLNKNELFTLVGGASISGALVNAFLKVVNTALEVGRSLGTAIRRALSKKKCNI